ncbi:hypothetical protein ACIBCR_27400 [Micromonospora echinospora]|uniref:hypothetical protein n=1 Tax=Micromonospora echinospora TaxID=1877 RepID=UPI00378F86F7
MLLAAGPVRSPGAASQSRLRFGESPEDEQAGAGRRLLWLDERPAFELSFWCGTCPLLFERLEGATSTCSMEDVERHLVDGLSDFDERVPALFGSLLPRGRYLPMLLRIQPRLVRPRLLRSGAGGDLGFEQLLGAARASPYSVLPDVRNPGGR